LEDQWKEEVRGGHLRLRGGEKNFSNGGVTLDKSGKIYNFIRGFCGKKKSRPGKVGDTHRKKTKRFGGEKVTD